MKTAFYTIGFLVILVIVFFIYLYLKIPDLGPVATVQEIQSTNFNEKIYLKSISWGLLGNSRIVVISKKDDINISPDTTNNFLFKGGSPFYYKFLNDTLTVYFDYESGFPQNFESNIKIKQVIIGSLILRNFKDSIKDADIFLLK